MTSVPDWRVHAPDLAVGVAVALLGLLEAADLEVYPPDSRAPYVAIALAMGAATALSRRLPGLALALVWVLCAVQVVAGVDLMLVQVAVAVVAFGSARWGRLATVWLSALSIPLAATLGVVVVGSQGLGALLDLAGFSSVVERAYQYGDTWQVGAGVVGMSLLGVPWLAGLSLRLGARAQASQASQVAAERDAARAMLDSEQAREIARLREEQARLARDVHDVVGHSLAVILAQAESAQYLDEADTRGLKQTMATIATSARSSLRDVRQVLTATTDRPAVVVPGDLDSLVEGVRAGGHEVLATEEGTPQPLPPELDVVAFRVLQEMLTNAVKHGRRGVPVSVERHWEGELRIEVRNAVGEAPEPDETQPLGRPQGLDGMRRRLESVGGRVDVRRREGASGPTFTATAWVPLRVGTR